MRTRLARTTHAILVKKMAFLDKIHSAVSSIACFNASYHDSNGDQCLVMSHVKLFDHAPLGKTSRVRITVDNTREYTVYVLFEEIEKGCLEKSSDITAICERYSTESTSYKFCAGYDPTEYRGKYYDVIGYHVKGVRQIDTPVHRVESSKCLKWHKIGKTTSQERKQAAEVLCRSCIIQRSHLDRQVQRKLAESPARKLKRQRPSSSAKLSYMSPFSQRKRKERQRNRTRSLKAKLSKYEPTEINLDDEQDREMENIMEVIEQEGSGKLENLFQEGEKHGVGQKLRDIWKADKRQKKDSFNKDQVSSIHLIREQDYKLVPFWGHFGFGSKRQLTVNLMRKPCHRLHAVGVITQGSLGGKTNYTRFS